jgi:addiction module HigA family antidote
MARLRTHPGEVLPEEYLVPLGLWARALAKQLGVPANRLTEIMRGTRDVTADTAIRLGRYFRTDPRFWLNLQAAHDLSKAEKANSYKKIIPRTAAPAHSTRVTTASRLTSPFR